jgi:hypothetical protein
MVALPTVPTQPAVGDLSTALWADQVAQWAAFLAAPPLFLGHQTTTQSLTSAAWTAISFDTMDVDTKTGWATGANTRYTAQYAGYYEIKGIVAFAANATGYRGAAIVINGAAIAGSSSNQTLGNPGAIAAYIEVVDEVFLNVNDFVQILGVQASGGALSTVTLGSKFRARWVSS